MQQKHLEDKFAKVFQFKSFKSLHIFQDIPHHIFILLILSKFKSTPIFCYTVLYIRKECRWLHAVCQKSVVIQGLSMGQPLKDNPNHFRQFFTGLNNMTCIYIVENLRGRNHKVVEKCFIKTRNGQIASLGGIFAPNITQSS